MRLRSLLSLFLAMADAHSGATSQADMSAVTVHACAAGADIPADTGVAPPAPVVDAGAASSSNPAAGSKYIEKNFAQSISGPGQNARLPGANRPAPSSAPWLVHCANRAATNGRGRVTPTNSATPAGDMSTRGSLPGTPPEGHMEDTRGGSATKRPLYQHGV